MENINNTPEKPGKLGNLKTITIQGIADMNIENMVHKEITLFVGANGTGKTLVLVMVWIISMLAMFYVKLRLTFKCIEPLQFLLDNCFTDQTWTGKASIDFGNLEIGFELLDGKVIDVIVDEREEIKDVAPPVFMSKNTRSYDDIVSYFRIKKLLGITDFHASVAENTKKLVGLYKIYDIFFMERLFSKVKDGYVLSAELSDTIHKMFKDVNSKCGKIVKLTYDDYKNDIMYEDTEGNIKSVCSLSAGEQSLLNIYSAV